MNTRRQRKLRRTRKQRGGSFLKQERSPLIEAILANDVDAVKKIIKDDPDSILQERSMGIGIVTGYLTKKNIAHYLLDFTLKEYNPGPLTPEDQDMLYKREEIIKSILKTKPEIIKKIPDAIEHLLLDIQQDKTVYVRLYKRTYSLDEKIKKLQILNYLIRVIVEKTNITRENMVQFMTGLNDTMNKISYPLADKILSDPGSDEPTRTTLSRCYDLVDWNKLYGGDQRKTLMCSAIDKKPPIPLMGSENIEGVYRYLWKKELHNQPRVLDNNSWFGRLVEPDTYFFNALLHETYSWTLTKH